jgi:hypothetical protein
LHAGLGRGVRVVASMVTRVRPAIVRADPRIKLRV